MPAETFLSHFDHPVSRPPSGALAVRGWVASTSPISHVRAAALPGIELKEEERPDVRAALSDYPHVRGFRGLVPEEGLINDRLELICETAAGEKRFGKELPVPVPPPDKKARLERLRPHLKKGLPFRETPFHFDFLTPEVRAKFHVSDTENVSEFAYATIVQEMIDANPNGLILDCGAGRRERCLPNVVNLEIVPYPSTDVLATNEELPFEDNTFDLVISCAVLEHVRFPFQAAKEIVRVTKPGGRIYADVPFLQPYHGYPSHFYNMTHQGLANLFSDSCEIEKSFVPRYGLPIWTLTWFLKSYLEGLPPEERARFGAMTVADLAADPMKFLDLPVVQKLSAEKNLELASVTSLLAKKKAAPSPQSEGFLGLFRKKK